MEDICHEFGEEFFEDFLVFSATFSKINQNIQAYEIFMMLLQIQCQKLQIDPQTV